jgi:hypothetical protein
MLLMHFFVSHWVSVIMVSSCSVIIFNFHVSLSSCYYEHADELYYYQSTAQTRFYYFHVNYVLCLHENEGILLVLFTIWCKSYLMISGFKFESAKSIDKREA